MNHARADAQAVTRRMVLTGTALSLGAALAGAPVSGASAQTQKLSQADASYQATPKGSQRCGVCFNFQQPNSCKFVQGPVSPNGWCQLFGPKS